MAFLQRPKRVLLMFYHWRQLSFLLDDLLYSPPRDPLEPIGIDDFVKKVTGDYHVKGYVRAVFRTKWTRKIRYVVEIQAEGGGSFCHIYARSNLEIIRRANPIGLLFREAGSDSEPD